MNSVHIVLCTYNGERYLGKLLQSLVDQTVPPKTVVVLDDASQDSSCAIVREYATRLPLRLYENHENTGHRAAFSKALEYARSLAEPGDLIALCDQDDFWLPQKIEILQKSIGRSALVFGDAQVIDAEGRVTAPSWRTLARINPETSIEREVAGINNVTGMLALFKAELLDRILPIPAGVTVHDRWIAMVAHKWGGVKSVGDIVAQYRIHGNNAVGGVAAPPMSKTLEIAKSWTETLIRNAERLAFTPAEIAFAERYLAWTLRRERCALTLRDLPWIVAHRDSLFLQGACSKRLRQIAFSVVGLPLARKLFGKS